MRENGQFEMEYLKETDFPRMVRAEQEMEVEKIDNIEKEVKKKNFEELDFSKKLIYNLELRRGFVQYESGAEGSQDGEESGFED